MYLLKRVALAMAMSFTSEGAIAQTMPQPIELQKVEPVAVADADNQADAALEP